MLNIAVSSYAITLNSILFDSSILVFHCITQPKLEEYLIANRTDYLRYSALNYTAEQKHFNNRLTEGLLELAAKHNYLFDESCFNFVAVRDRIRCYYKSYVQSSKKRGVVVGFPKVNNCNSSSAGDGTREDTTLMEEAKV